MKYLILFLALVPAWAQRETYGNVGNAYTKFDMSAALSSRPVPEKASDPGTCTEGMRYYNTTSHKGRICTGTNTWADETGGGSGNMSITTQAGVPSGGCTAATTWVLDTTAQEFYGCTVSGTYKRILSTLDSGISVIGMLEGTAPGAGASAGVHNLYFDVADHRLKSHVNGGSVATYYSTFNPQTAVSGNAGGLAAAYIDWNASSGGSSILNKPTLVTTSTTDTFTNKTIDAEGTGNSITIPVKVWLPAVSCAGTTGALMWDTLASNAPTATCSAGTTETTMMRGVADFPDSDGAYSMQQPILLPDDWTGAIDVKFLYRTTATSGNTIWQAATSCRADAEVDDAAFNTASVTSADAAKGTTNQLNTASIAGVTATGCAAGELLHLKIFRDRTHASDTITGVVSLVGVEVTLRRAM